MTITTQQDIATQHSTHTHAHDKRQWGGLPTSAGLGPNTTRTWQHNTATHTKRLKTKCFRTCFVLLKTSSKAMSNSKAMSRHGRTSPRAMSFHGMGGPARGLCPWFYVMIIDDGLCVSFRRRPARGLCPRLLLVTDQPEGYVYAYGYVHAYD